MWKIASRSSEGKQSFLNAMEQIGDPAHRASLYDVVRPLMFDAPGATGPSPGLHVSVYRPSPRNPDLKSFGGLSPKAMRRVRNFTLDMPEVGKGNSFGLLFSGTLDVPEKGKWTFFTKANDGSRLFIDDRLVVNNDGSNNMKEKRGTLRLDAGRHEIVVTYFNRGSTKGLEVYWKGPGLRKQRIPDGVLSDEGGDPVRAAAVRAMAHVPGHETEKFEDGASLIGGGTLLNSAVFLIRQIPRAQWTEDRVRPVIDAIAAYASSLPAKERTSPDVRVALELGDDLASVLPGDEAAASRRRLKGLGGTVILIRTVPHKMIYDRTEFFVEAGKPVAIVFQNNDVMPHNLVITKPGRMEIVGEAAERMGAEPDAEQKQYIPETKDVLWHTELLYPGLIR